MLILPLPSLTLAFLVQPRRRTRNPSFASCCFLSVESSLALGHRLCMPVTCPVHVWGWTAYWRPPSCGRDDPYPQVRSQSRGPQNPEPTYYRITSCLIFSYRDNGIYGCESHIQAPDVPTPSHGLLNSTMEMPFGRVLTDFLGSKSQCLSYDSSTGAAQVGVQHCAENGGPKAVVQMRRYSDG